ncbi:MAG: DUF2145 domain-containing protein [Rubrivivax sp.]
MNTRRPITALALAAVLVLAATSPAQAGRDCESAPPTAQAVQRGLELAERTARALDASGAEVVVLARAGQDLSRWRLRWSHLGLAYRDPYANGAWRVVHKLNHCGSDQAAVYRQGLGEFFLDDPHEYVAGYAVLTTDLQTKLLALLQDNRRIAQLNTPAYNMVAYPWATQYQQSNQWAIETLAMGAEPAIGSRDRAQAWLQFKDYRPGVLRIDTFTRLGARMTSANVAFDDHPNSKRFAGRIETVTADSVFEWLAAAGLATGLQVQR